jgi:hypothetical protein
MKKYNIHAFLETSAIENSCDFAMWEFRGPDQIRDHKLLAGVLKNRDSKIINHFYLQENFAKSYIGNDDGGISQSTLRGPELGELLRGIIS